MGCPINGCGACTGCGAGIACTASDINPICCSAYLAAAAFASFLLRLVTFG